MLCIYRINDPAPLSENLYSEVLKNGEVKHCDLDYIFDTNLGIGSYTDHFTNLALRLRVIDEAMEHNYYVLSDKTANTIRRTDPGEQLFDVLTRLPHFARWVQLTHTDDNENVDYNDVVPCGERKYKMRQQRVNQFESWADKITELAEDTTFDALQAEYERQSAYIWEDYISFDDIETNLDPVVLLVLLGGAANGGASCKTSRLVDTLPCGHKEFQTIVDDVFTPAGVPLYRTTKCIGLNLPTELRADNLKTLWSQVSELFDDAVDISSLEHLTNHLQYDTNILDFVETPQNTTLQFTVIDGLHESETPSRDAHESLKTKFDTILPVDNAAFVAIPPSTSGVTTQDLFGEIEQVLEAVEDGQDVPHQHSRFEYHVREQLYHLGSIPLLKAPDFETLTTVGEQYLQQNMTARRSLIFDHLLARNPPVRTMIAAADANPFRMEQAGESWVIRTDHDEIRVHAVSEELSERDDLTMIGIDSTDPVQQIVSYLCTSGILKGQGAVNQLQISSPIHEHLKQNPRGSRQLLEQSKDRLQGMVEELK